MTRDIWARSWLWLPSRSKRNSRVSLRHFCSLIKIMIRTSRSMSFIRALMDLESKSLNAISMKCSSTWTKTATVPSTTRSSVASLRKREETLTPSILRTTNWDLLRAFRTRDSITKASKLCRRIHITTFRLTCKLSISMSSKVDLAPRTQNLLTQSIATLNPRPKLWR